MPILSLLGRYSRLLTATGLLLVPAAGIANTGPEGAATAESDSLPPVCIQSKAFIQSLADKTLNLITNDQASDQETLQQLEILFEQSVDLDWVSRFVLGRYWRQATEEQRQAYQKYYKRFLVHHYTSRFKEYSSETYDISSLRPDKQDDACMVRMVIKRPDEPELIVDYRIRKAAKNNYRIFDIIVEGVSLITTQRSEFGSVVSRKGLDFLIERLEAKSKQAKEKA